MISIFFGLARGQIAAQRFAPRLHDTESRAESSAGLHEGDLLNCLFRQVQFEAVRQVEQLILVQLLLLVGDVLAFAGFAQAIALDGLGQDDGRLALRARNARLKAL